MSPDCSRFEELLSAHLDGEASPEMAVAALEHALTCASCRAFYDRSRAVERELAGEVDGDEEALPERVWEEVRRASGWSAAPVRRRGRGLRPGWVFAVAAGVAAAVGLSLWLSIGPGASSHVAEQAAARALREAPGTPVAANGASAEPEGGAAAGAAARMTDERFVAITRELLGSDPRYLRAMEGVLREVGPVREGGGSSEDMPVRGEGVGLLPARGPV